MTTPITMQQQFENDMAALVGDPSKNIEGAAQEYEDAKTAEANAQATYRDVILKKLDSLPCGNNFPQCSLNNLFSNLQ